MTTEDDFQAALDANPDDWQTRLVFADWLEEHGDERAAGYRALGRRRRRAKQATTASGTLNSQWFFWHRDAVRGPLETFFVQCRGLADHDNELPKDWFAVTVRTNTFQAYGPWIGYTRTRAELEDAAALAFTQLPAERRAELLAAADPT